MRKVPVLLFFYSIILLAGCTRPQTEKDAAANQPQEQAVEVSVMPRPRQIDKGQGSFRITADTKIHVEKDNSEALRLANLLAFKLRKAAGLDLSIVESTETSAPDNGLLFTTKNAPAELGKEGYKLSATDKGVVVQAPSPTGLFYGLQTIYQLLPPQIESQSRVQDVAWVLPAVQINDKPRYTWRGLHLDVGRHFMPVAFVKKYIDNMAIHKLNTFHWHLTEDQGWRIEIKKYPKLTDIGAWRKETLIGHYSDQPHKYDNKRYGGFYTQEEVKEVVQYAKDRFITVVPEIEMPGHASASISAYPYLGVPGKPIEVATKWGIFPDIYNVEDTTFAFLEDVLTEVMALFPSEYIHIGGDEAIKEQWQASPKIQQKIKELGLKDEHELQSYFITRIEKFLNAHGRKLIGWDEILEGGLAPNAAVMSWRGISGGIAAAKSNHYVVMSPGTHVYFDHYQGNPTMEPIAIGGYLPLKRVYAYEPTPDSLTAEEAKYIMGAQANVWTEYMKTPEHIEYMVFPRIAALAEVVWSPKEARDWESFVKRLPEQLKRYELRGINYAKSIYNVDIVPAQDSATNTFVVRLENELDGLNNTEIRYTLDGSRPTATSETYTKPINLNKSATIKAGVFKDGQLMGKITEQPMLVHKAFGKKPQLKNTTNHANTAKTSMALTDGIVGQLHHELLNWHPVREETLEAEIDLGKVDTLSKITTRFLTHPRNNLFAPLSLAYEVSEDGQRYTSVGEFTNTISKDTERKPAIETFTKEFAPKKARYIRVKAKNVAKVPAGHPYAGKKAALRIDEIVVE